MDNQSQHKEIDDFKVVENRHLSPNYSLLILKPESLILNEASILPGQFVQVATPDNSTFLRRPISVCNVDQSSNTLWLLVRTAGAGTKAINDSKPGDRINIILPLGHGFSTTGTDIESPLLVGGGVGVAPLIYLGKKLKEAGVTPRFLLGARSKNDLLLIDEFKNIGEVFMSTDDGSAGVHGLVTQHPIMHDNHSMIYCCGPMPMMKAVAKIARETNTNCEVSLENLMGCGIGACLCCVEKTKESGNVCVCTQGPVFNINQLQW